MAQEILLQVGIAPRVVGSCEFLWYKGTFLFLDVREKVVCGVFESASQWRSVVGEVRTSSTSFECKHSSICTHEQWHIFIIADSCHSV